MKNKRKCCLFAAALLTMFVPLCAQNTDPSSSIMQARVMLEDAIRSRFVGTLKTRFALVMRPATYVLSEATDIHVGTSGFSFSAHVSPRYPDDDGRVIVNFKKRGIGKHCEVGPEGDIQVYRPDLGKTTARVGADRNVWGHDKVISPTPLYSVAYSPDPEHARDFFGCREQLTIFAWTDEAKAREFADAFNRLLYAARHHEMDPDFIAVATAWRALSTTPRLSPEADRERILAENAIKEGKELGSADDNAERLKKLDSAIEHFGKALEIQPTWPAGWFNLALLYAEQKSYADATDAMKHYLELVPDASDAQAAREQMIIWEDKAKQ